MEKHSGKPVLVATVPRVDNFDNRKKRAVSHN